MPITITGGSPISGRADARLGAFATSMAGTSTEAPARAGSMNPALGDFGISLEGIFVANSTRDGDLSATLGAFSAGLAGTSVAPNTTTWLPIEDTLPAGTERDMLAYLSDPAGNIPAGNTFVDGVLSGGASYDPITGILTYGTEALSGIRMGANDGVLATETVTSAAELISAINNANAGGGYKEILVADGTYSLSAALPQVTAPAITVRGQSGNRGNVIIRGDAMAAGAAVTNILTTQADQTAVKDLTLRLCANHLIQVKGEAAASSFLLDNCVLQDGYEQFLKVSDDGSANYSDNGIVQDCLFEYTTAPLNWYSGGIDAHHARGWVVRRNTFKGFQSPATAAMEHAVHFWDNCSNITTERNTIIDCDRGIGYGLSSGQGVVSGVIRNNMVARVTSGVFNDVGIGLADCTDVECYNNTVYLADQAFVAIDYRYATSSGLLIANNLTNDSISARDGATATLTTNITNAQASWFVDPATGDLRLSQYVATVIDQGTAVTGLFDDIDGESRPKGEGIDVGADESDYAAPFTPLNVAGLWAWADVDDENSAITTSSFGAYTNIATLQNLATPGTNDFSQSNNERRPGYAANGFSITGYSTTRAPIAVENVPGVANVYGQAMAQAGSLGAAAEFYLLVGIGNTRSNGDRYMLGSDTSNMVRLNQEKPNDHLKVAIAGGGETQVCPDGSIPPDASLLEIWRDGADVIHVAVNGSEVGSGVTMPGTFNLSGYGGGAFNWDSAWDDWLMTYLAVDGLPDTATRQQLRDFVNTRWGIY